MRIGTLIGTSILALIVAASAGAEGQLRPLAWESATFSDTALDGRDARFDSLCRLISTSPSGGANVYCGNATVQGVVRRPLDNVIDPNEPFTYDLGALHVGVELVSELDGNRWRVGFRNLAVSSGLVPEVGDPIAVSTNGWFRLGISAEAQASFDVPVTGQRAFTDVAFGVGPGVLRAHLFGLRSRLSGDFLESGIRPVESFRRNDEITLYGDYRYPTKLLELVIAATSDATGSVVETRTVTVSSPCGVRNDMSDCLVDLDLSTSAPAFSRIQFSFH